MKLIIREKALTHIESHAQAEYPNECCGFLYGVDTDERMIEHALEAKNSKEGDKRRSFEISPLDYLKAEKYAIENDLQLLGIYHSHPNHPAKPSEHDRVQAVEFFSYIITSVADDKINTTTSWRLNEQKQFIQEEIYTLITTKI